MYVCMCVCVCVCVEKLKMNTYKPGSVRYFMNEIS